MKERIKAHICLLRAFAAPWVVANFLLGGFYGGLGLVNLHVWLLTMLGMIMVLFGGHYFNAYWDFKIGLDRLEEGSKPKVYTSASQVLPSGVVTPLEVLTGTVLWYFLGSLLITYAALSTSLWLLMPPAIGVLMGVTYSTHFKRWGFGEICLFSAHGVACTTVGFISVTGTLSLNVLLVSFITGAWATLAYGVDQWKDRETDLLKRVKTVAIRIASYDMKISNYVQLWYFFITFYHMTLVLAGLLTPSTLISILTFLPVFMGILTIDTKHDLGSVYLLIGMITYPLLMCVGLLL